MIIFDRIILAVFLVLFCLFFPIGLMIWLICKHIYSGFKAVEKATRNIKMALRTLAKKRPLK